MSIADRLHRPLLALFAGAALGVAAPATATPAPPVWRAVDGTFALPIMCRHADALAAFDRPDVSQEALAGLIRDGECQRAAPNMGFHVLAREAGLASIAVTVIDSRRTQAMAPTGQWWVHEIDVTYFTLPHTPQSRIGGR